VQSGTTGHGLSDEGAKRSRVRTSDTEVGRARHVLKIRVSAVRFCPWPLWIRGASATPGLPHVRGRGSAPASSLMPTRAILEARFDFQIVKHA
jgi:hypothetical protein